MRVSRCVLVLLALGLLGAGCWRQRPVTSTLKRVQKSNGLVIITEATEANAIVAVNIVLKSGSRNDPVDRRGLHTLMQRCLRKGTKQYTEEALNEALDRIGASISAGADRDFCSVSLQCTARHLEAALPLLFEVLKQPVFPQAEVEKTKEQILRDIQERRDDMLSYAFDLFQDTYYGKYPYHHPLGVESELRQASQAEVLALFQKVYQPNCMIVSVVGPVQDGKLRRLFAKELGWDVSDAETPTEAVFGVPSPNAQTIIRRQSSANWVVLGYPAAPLKHGDEIPLRVMNGLLGGGMDSRLFREVRDKKGLAYQVGSLYAARLGPSFWGIYFGTKNGQYEAARDAALQEVRRIREDLVDTVELEHTKAYLKGTFLISQERNMSRAELYARYEAEGRPVNYAQTYLKAIDAVTREDVQRMAQTYLTGVPVMGAIFPK